MVEHNNERLYDLGERKLQQVSGCFMISVPGTWAKTHQAAKGDSMNMKVDVHGRLIITPVSSSFGG